MDLVVGKIGRAHGLAGEVGVEVRTDRPDVRFAPSAVLVARPTERGPLTVSTVRRHHGRLLVRFDGIDDRTAAEALIGTELLVAVDPRLEPGEVAGDDETTSDNDQDAYYDHELVGLRAVDPKGQDLGTVREVVHMPAHDLLVVARTDAPDALVPFVAAIVPEVDLAAQTVTVIDPGGLLDLAESAES